MHMHLQNSCIHKLYAYIFSPSFHRLAANNNTCIAFITINARISPSCTCLWIYLIVQGVSGGQSCGQLAKSIHERLQLQDLPISLPVCGIYLIVLVDSLVQKDSSVCQNIKKFGGSIWGRVYQFVWRSMGFQMKNQPSLASPHSSREWIQVAIQCTGIVAIYASQLTTGCGWNYNEANAYSSHDQQSVGIQYSALWSCEYC